MQIQLISQTVILLEILVSRITYLSFRSFVMHIYVIREKIILSEWSIK